MRKPTSDLSLHDVPLDLADGECDDENHHDVGLCCPDEPLDKVMSCIPVLDDALLEALGIDCSPPREAPAPAPVPAARDEDDGAEDMDMDVDVVVREVESALGAAAVLETSARDLSRRVPEFAATMPGGRLGTCTAPAGFLAEKGAPPLPVRALSRSTPTPLYCGLSTTSVLEAESPETPEPASPFQACTVPRKQRGRPGNVRKGPWPVAYPSFLGTAAATDSHDNNNGNDGHVGQFSCGSGGGRRRAVPRQRNRQQPRTCGHCHTSETPQWRQGPNGPGTLCNACGIRYKMGTNKLVPEYRPRRAPSFRSDEHSNRHSKVVKLGEKEKVMAAPVQLAPNSGEDQRDCLYR